MRADLSRLAAVQALRSADGSTPARSSATFSLEDAAEAYAAMDERRATKVLLRP